MLCAPRVNATSRHQPWSTYAVYLTTVSHWAFVWDTLLVYFFLDMATPWQSDTRDIGLAMLIGWMFLSKFVKLLGHYIRYPADFFLLPVSIGFGYLHGLIKGYAMLSLNVVSPPSFALLPHPNFAASLTGHESDDIRRLILKLSIDCVGKPRGRRRRRCVPHETGQPKASRGPRFPTDYCVLHAVTMAGFYDAGLLFRWLLHGYSISLALAAPRSALIQ